MDLLIGFTTILIVIACGAALAHVGVLDARSQRTLGEIAFFVARSPTSAPRPDAGSVLIGALSASYVNAGNLGIAVAAFVVGDTTVVVPTLLVQMMIVQPIALMVLDRLTGRGVGAWSTIRRLVTNRLTLASVVGSWRRCRPRRTSSCTPRATGRGRMLPARPSS